MLFRSEADRSLLVGVFKHGGCVCVCVWVKERWSVLARHLFPFFHSLQHAECVCVCCLSMIPGYEMYTTMRADPCLCFLERAGRPDDRAIDAEQHTGDAELGDE